MSARGPKNFKSRIFGGDLPLQVKKKLESRQILAKKSTDPNQPFESKFQDLRTQSYTHDALNKQNFNGIADLSSRTPFARMWTAVKIAEDTITKETMTDEDIKDIKLKPDEFLYEKKLHKWDYIDDTTKIYVVGDHTLNSLEKSPNSPLTQKVTSDDTKISADVMRALTPNEQETDFNELLKPPAGITSISSTTEGPMGILRTTSVEFIVHNFSDFERIYMRYFLRPGAQVFIDYGWDTAPIYEPKELLESNSSVEQYLWGDKGIITNSGGDMETSVGHVTDYSATIRDDGGFDCSLEIVSKNGVILQSGIDESFKKRVEWGLDTELLGLAIAHHKDEKKFYEKSKAWGGENNQLGVDDKTELEEAYKLAASTIIGGQDISLPGMIKGDNESFGKITMETGIYYGGVNDNNYQIFVNYGFFEDKILNKELGFSDTSADLTNSNNSKKNKSDEGDLKAKFNSRNSFVTFNSNLRQGMLDREGYKEVDMLYPANWGHTYKTYNTMRKMVPDDRIDDLNTETNTYNTDWEELDKKNKRIPMREVFLRLDMIKQVIEGSDTVPDILRQLCERINKSTGNITDLSAGTNAYAANTISLMDKNVVSAVDIDSFIGNGGGGTNPDSDVRQSFLNELFVFKPYSPESIVKEYNLDFSMPDGAMGNMIAIQGSSNGNSRAQAIGSTLSGLVAMEETERFGNKDSKNLYVKWIPKVGQQAAQRMHENLQHGGNKTFNFDEGDSIFGEAMDEGGNYSFSFKDRSERGLEDNENGIQELTSMIKNAIQPGIDVYGKEVTAPKTVTNDEIDDASDDNARRNNEEVVSNVYKYWIAQARQELANSVLPLIEAKLTLKIYGVAGIRPGDIFRCDYIPEQYFQTCFWQVMGITHSVGTDGWSTEIEGQMRLLPTLKPIGLGSGAPKPKVKMVNVISSIGGSDSGEQKALNHNLKFLSNGTPLKLNEIFGDGQVPQNLSKAIICEFTKDGVDFEDAEDNYYVWFEFDKLKDYNIHKGYVGDKSTTTSGKSSNPGSFISDYNSLGKGGASKTGNQGWEGDKLMRIDDFDITWSTGTTGARNYYYRAYFERGKFKKGDKIMIVASKQGNWLFLPNAVGLLSKHGDMISRLFADSKETWGNE